MLTNFVSVLGILLVAAFVVMGIYYLVSVLRGYFAMIRQEKTYRSQYNYSSYANRVNRETPDTTPYELYKIRSRISELENKINDVETILEVGDHGDFECDFTTTIPEDIQNLRDEVETLTRSVNDLKEKQDDFIRLVGDLQEKQNCLESYYKGVRQVAGVAYDKVKNIEKKITVGDNPNNMTSVTMQEASND